MFTLSEAVRNAMIDTVAALVDAGSGPAYVEVRTDTRPSDPDTAATGTLLVTIPLNDPAFDGPGSFGYVFFDATGSPSGTAVASGTAGWCRVYDSDDNALMDGLVGLDGDEAEFILDSIAVTSGQVVSLAAYGYLGIEGG